MKMNALINAIIYIFSSVLTHYLSTHPFFVYIMLMLITSLQTLRLLWRTLLKRDALKCISERIISKVLGVKALVRFMLSCVLHSKETTSRETCYYGIEVHLNGLSYKDFLMLPYLSQSQHLLSSPALCDSLFFTNL